MNRLGVLGNPLGHSISPQMHNAALEALNMTDWSYELVETTYEQLDGTIKRLAREFQGFNVTIPYKEKIIPWLDGIDRYARAAGAVNTVKVEDGCLFGTNTDGRGYLKSLEDRNIDVTGMKVLILGSGGAARGVSTAMGLSGAGSIDISSRKKERGMRLVHILKALKVQSNWLDFANLGKRKIGGYDLIVNTTPVGMSPHDGDLLAFPYDLLEPHQVLSDLIYRPQNTRFLQEGTKRGLTTVDGLGMLLHQGALAFSHWTGQQAPLDVMEQALTDALKGPQE